MTKERTREGRALAGLSLSVFMASLDTSIANAGLPALARVFSASFHQVQWIVLAYLLAVTSIVVTAGRLGDVLGRRRSLLVGVSLFLGASLLCGVAPVLWLLIAGRALQGLGAAVMLSLSMASIGEVVPKGRTGTAMGVLGTMSAVGTAFGPAIGGLLISSLGWRSIFLVNVPIGVLALSLVHRNLPPDPERPKFSLRSFDPLGTAILAGTLAAYSLASTVGEGSIGPLNLAFLIAAVLGVVMFVRAESRVDCPLVDLSDFRKGKLSGNLITAALVASVMMSTLVVGPFYLSRSFGLGPLHAGLALSLGPAVVASTSVLSGRLVDRFGAREMAFVGLVAMAVGLLLLSLTSPALGVPGYLVPIVTVTSGYSIFQASNNTDVLSKVPRGRSGVASGLVNLARNLGLITGASVLGALFAFATGSQELSLASSQKVAEGTRITFGAATAMIAVALTVGRGPKATPIDARTSDRG